VRIHLKDLTLGLLAAVSDPSSQEWAIFESTLEPVFRAATEGRSNLDRFAGLAWRHFQGAAAWFRYAEQQGLIQSWLASANDGVVNLAFECIWVLLRRF